MIILIFVAYVLAAFWHVHLILKRKLKTDILIPVKIMKEQLIALTDNLLKYVLLYRLESITGSKRPCVVF
jgi:hypothetical protein